MQGYRYITMMYLIFIFSSLIEKTEGHAHTVFFEILPKRGIIEDRKKDQNTF